MKYFIGLQKKKALYLGDTVAETNNAAQLACAMLNEELINLGFILAPATARAISTLSLSEVDALYHELIHNLKELMPDGENFQPVHKGFPQSVLDKTEEELQFCRIGSYFGMEIPEDQYVNEIAPDIDVNALTRLGTLTEKQFKSIFSNLLASPSSLSRMDLKMVEWFLLNNYPYKITDIKFKETLAHVGAYCFNYNKPLNTKNAIDILRIWSGYSGGDVGLVDNTKFKNPTNKQKRQLLSTLDKCYNLEEAFKMDRERWLRLLFYLNPMTTGNKFAYPNVYKYTNLLRNNPKELRTFNSYIEEGLDKQDENVLDLLSKRMGVFTRRLDHCVRIFGTNAIDKWLSNGPNVKQMIEAYNHFYNRDKVQTRNTVLASIKNSTAVTYKSLDTLPTTVVESTRDKIRTHLEKTLKTYKNVFIHPSLYNRALSVNNRAASEAITSQNTGSFETLDPTINQIRTYVLWEGRTDIDYSGWIIDTDGNPIYKIGFAGDGKAGNSVIYSGDNTGNYDKNAEYVDIYINNLLSEFPNTEWVLLEARIYSGSNSFHTMKTYTGYMYDSKGFNPGTQWYPEYNKHAARLESQSNVAFLNALHIPTRSIVHLDVTQAGSHVSNTSTISKFYPVLVQYTPTVGNEISWDRIKQGHILDLLSTNIVDIPENADIIFDEHTTTEDVWAAVEGNIPTS